MKSVADRLTPEIFGRAIREADSICILGHVGPDGDCIGSCLGAYNYIRNLPGGEDKRIDVYLDNPNEKFAFLKGFSVIKNTAGDGEYALTIMLDCASVDRLGRFGRYYNSAALSILIDHHATNPGFADYALIEGGASSACEVLSTLMEPEYFDAKVAECIYTGLVHDTGVFRYSSTGRSTMELAGRCMELGVDFGSIIEESFFAMSYDQKRMLGYILYNMESRFDGKLVYTYLDLDTRIKTGGTDLDLDGMIDNMRTTSGALAAVFLYETADGRVKASLRSNSDLIDVSAMAKAYGGGGHKRAAGCFMKKDPEGDIEALAAMFAGQLGIQPGTGTLEAEK